MSNLHLESEDPNFPNYNSFEIPPRAPYLTLLGNIGNAIDDDLFTFLLEQLGKFCFVFFVIGNHELYYSSYPNAKESLQDFAMQVEEVPKGNEKHMADNKLGVFVLLDQTRFELTLTVTLLGCTLFSDVDNFLGISLSDFVLLKDWDIDQQIVRHGSDLQWLNEQIAKVKAEEPDRRIVIFTHHSPTTDKRACDPKQAHIIISSVYATDLSAQVCCTSSGGFCLRTHSLHCDFFDETTATRFFTNLRGYPSEFSGKWT